MSADNELVIAEFTDCWVVKQQFASYWWSVDTEYPDPIQIREDFKGGRIFHSEKEAEDYADKEDFEEYYEYGVSTEEFNFPFVEILEESKGKDV